MLVILLALGCTGGSDSKGPVDTSGDSGDTSDTAGAAVWDQYRIETSSTLNGVYASGDGVYVVGSDGYGWVGGTDEWAYLTPDVDGEDFNGLWGQGVGDSLALAAVANTGRIARYSAGTWTTDDLDDVGDYFGIGGSGPNALIAVGWGRALHFDGTTWTAETLPANENLNDVYALADDAFAVGEEGVILKRGGGGVWTAESSGVTASFNSIAGSAMNDVWAVGDLGTAVHYDGSSWSVVATGIDETLWGVFVPEAGTAFAVGNNGTALSWNGTTWDVLPTGVDNNLYAIHGVSSTNMWATGNRGMAMQYKAD